MPGIQKWNLQRKVGRMTIYDKTANENQYTFNIATQ